MSKETLVINLYGGPGTGKSTTASLVYSHLKLMNINCELVREFAKDLVWEERKVEFDNQLSVLGQQIKRQNALKNKVDIIITDSPILLSVIYNISTKDPLEQTSFTNVCKQSYEQFKNIDFFLNRTKEYNPSGRFQTESEADEKSKEIKDCLNDLNIKHLTLDATKDCYKDIIKYIAEEYPQYLINVEDYESMISASLALDNKLRDL